MAITKDAGLRIRVEKDLREAFTQACRDQNLVAADVLRDFMREFTRQHVRGQGSLFEAATKQRAIGERRTT